MILDSWSSTDKDAYKLLKKIGEYFSATPIICMQQVDSGAFSLDETIPNDRTFNTIYLWSLPRNEIRNIVAAYNESKYIGDEDAVTNRLVSDLDVLNLHRTPLNCLTLLKVSEIDFDESPVNRSEMIKRVLFLLFNIDDVPTYKARPDLKDCEYVLGYFCELLIRDNDLVFTRERFLSETQKCSKERLIDLETQVVFDVLYANNILIKRGNYFSFRFAYWVFYFVAQRMHHDAIFARYIFDEMRYAQHPEIIEFYTGIDRRREDALEVLIGDLQETNRIVREKCGFPEDMNPYRFAQWLPSPEMQAQMEKEISHGIRESNFPAVIKDQYADKNYDQTRPYDQSVNNFHIVHSYTRMTQTMRACARALRNSDYVSPDLKRQLLAEILNCWELASKVLFVILPALAAEKKASFDGAYFVLSDDFSDSPQKRLYEILIEIPRNVVSWFRDDLYSQKMGPLLIDQLSNKEVSDIGKHELILLLIQTRPRDWNKQIQKYIIDTSKNSFYLFDVYRALRSQYRYGFVSPTILKDMEYLIRMAATKHVTGAKSPSIKVINKTKFIEDVIPPREE